MKQLSSWLLFILLSSLGLSSTFGQLESTDDSADDFSKSDEFVFHALPETTAIYFRLAPAEAWLDHPFTQTIQSSDVVKTLWKSEPLLQLRGGIALVQFALGAKLENIARDLSIDGVHIAIDRKTEGVVLLSKTRSEEWLSDYIEKVVSIARSDATSKKKPDPIKEATYRDVHGYEVNHVIVAQLSDWILVTNKSELAKSIIDRIQVETDDSFAKSEFFRKAIALKHDTLKKSAKSNASAIDIGYVVMDIDGLRQAGVAKDLLSPKPRDFGAELLVGGLLKVLQDTPIAVGSLSMEPSSMQMQWTVASDLTKVCETHEFFVGPAGSGTAQRWIDPAQSIAGISTYRNLSELWLRAGDLFDQNVNDQLAQADNTLTTLFAGKDFGTDILGAIEPQLQVLVASQSFDQQLKPAIQLPSVALVGRLKDPAKMKIELKRTFQSFIGFLNVAGAMEGQPQLDLNTQTEDGSQIYWGEYVLDADKKYEKGLPIQFNFSPAIAFRDEQIIVSSSVDFAKRLIAAGSHSDLKTIHESADANTLANVDMQSLQSLLVANRDQLISQNMIEKGHSQKEASAEVDMLLSLLKLFKQASADLTFGEATTFVLRLDLQTNPVAKSKSPQP